MLALVIEDDGIGFDPEAKQPRGSFGLTALRERVEILGGRIGIQSRRAGPGVKQHGTRIEVGLPLPGAQQSRAR